MFITTSKKSNLLSKRFSKYLSIFLPNIKYIPRGKTPIFKIFENARYLGHDFFLKTSFNRDKIKLSIYSFKENSYFLEREYLIEILDLRHFLSLKEILKNNSEVNDQKKVFYFLSKNNISKKKNFGVFYKEDNIFEFLKDNKYLGFKFKIMDVKRFD